MSDERVFVSVKRDHIHLFNRLFLWNEAAQTWIADPGVWLTIPGLGVEMGNMCGAMNAAEREQYDQPPIMLQEFRDGDPRFLFTPEPGRVHAIPFRIGPGPFVDPHGYASMAEFGGNPTYRSASLSFAAGDKAGFIRNNGTQVTLDFWVGQNGVQAGSVLYYNLWQGADTPAAQAGFSVQFPR